MTADRAPVRDLPDRSRRLPPRRETGGPRLARQPVLGLAGIGLVVPVALALSAGLGSLERSLVVFAPLSTFAFPVVVMVAFWWNDWPGTMLRAPWLGLSDTLLVLAGGVALTIAGQAVVAHVDLVGVFDPDAPLRHVPTFPATMALGAAIFIAMLQVTLVAERGPLRRLPAVPAGVLALAVAWAAGVGVYEATVPTALLHAAELGSILVCIGALQVLVYVVARGWPFAAIQARAPRLAAANAAVIGCGCLAYLLLAGAADLRPGTITAAAGSVVAAGLLVGMQLDDWLDSRLTPARARAGNLTAVGVLSLLLYVGLQAVAHGADWMRAEPEDWTGHVALNAIGAGVILHVAIGRRWPFPSPQSGLNPPVEAEAPAPG